MGGHNARPHQPHDFGLQLGQGRWYPAHDVSDVRVFLVQLESLERDVAALGPWLGVGVDHWKTTLQETHVSHDDTKFSQKAARLLREALRHEYAMLEKVGQASMPSA